jgi:hypothetical protein
VKVDLVLRRYGDNVSVNVAARTGDVEIVAIK